jgi:5'-nucleotidase
VAARPLLLITNDDGVHSPGLRAAAEAVADLGDLLVVAPATQQTSMSRAFVTGPTAGVVERIAVEIAGRVVDFFAVTGSPAMAVTHGMLELADRLPALCISGINYGENIGGGLGISGTIGAAMQAQAFGVPSLAASLQVDVSEWLSHDSKDWTAAAYFTRKLTLKLLSEGFPEDVSVINLNVPRNATLATELRRTFQSRSRYYVQSVPSPRLLSDPVRLKIKVNVDREHVEPGSDVHALVVDEVVSVTPLTWSMTATTDWRP